MRKKTLPQGDSLAPAPVLPERSATAAHPGMHFKCKIAYNLFYGPPLHQSSATPRPAMAASIKAFRRFFGNRARPGYVIHPGTIRLSLAPGITALPFSEL